MGAEVLRVDRPTPAGAFEPAPAEYDLLKRSRRSVILDLRHPLGLAAALRLVERADVLIEGFRPGVTERLGIGPDVCLERNPALVYGRMTGWGQDGPWAGAAGHDISYLAVTGALHAFGRHGGPPQVPANLLGDFGGGGTYLVMGVLAALWEASRSGHGQVVDAAIVDGVASLSTMLHGLLAAGAWRDERGVNFLDTGYPPYDVYETSDAKWVAVGALEEKFYAELLSVLGLTDVPDRDDPEAWTRLRARIAAVFSGRTRAEWAAIFDGTDACMAPVLSLTESPEHPQLAARGTFVEVDAVVQPAPAPRFSRTPSPLPTPPSPPGQHTSAALADWGVEDVDVLLDAGAAVQT
jgi:alpha-methylacyl-CoA racemase